SDNSIIADGYFVSDAVVSYTIGKANLSLIGENIFNTKWNEAQFATLTRLQNELNPVEEIHFTPGNPFFLRLAISCKL
ncbi:MAG TPA: TonB-dependent receptor, partial [Saprospiraceae bacterium]|nr:TonB-dependent receptor [Saprospiraceae bacterium]